MLQSKQEKRIFIIALLLSLLIHIIVLFFLFTYKTERDINLNLEKKEELIILPIIQTPSQQPAFQPMPPLSQIPLQQQQPPQQQLYNPHSEKEAETLDGASVTDDTKNESGATPLTQHEEDKKAPKNESVTVSAVSEETASTHEDDEPESEEELQEDLEDEFEQDTQEEAGDRDDQPAQPAQHEQEKSEDESSRKSKKEEVLTTQDKETTTTFKPIISKRYKEKARAKLAQLGQKFTTQYHKTREKKEAKANDVAARARKQESDLQTMSYRQKIDQAIHDAAFRAGPVYSDMDLNQMIKVIITLDKDGNVTKFNFVHKTKSSLINNYITKIIKSADFPPLPKKLNLQSWSYGWQPLLRVRRGKNNLNYHYT